MSGAYALIIISWINGYAVTIHDFTTEARCEEAKSIILEGSREWTGGHLWGGRKPAPMRVKATCRPQ